LSLLVPAEAINLILSARLERKNENVTAIGICLQRFHHLSDKTIDSLAKIARPSRARMVQRRQSIWRFRFLVIKTISRD
jgi:hypothetical protein